MCRTVGGSSTLGSRARLIVSAMLAVSAVSALMFVGCGSDDGGDDNGGNNNGGNPTNPLSTSYRITFNSNGGTVSPTFDSTGTDGKLASLPVPTRNEYTFNGWYTSSTGGTEVTTSTVFSANINPKEKSCIIKRQILF